LNWYERHLGRIQLNDYHWHWFCPETSGWWFLTVLWKLTEGSARWGERRPGTFKPEISKTEVKNWFG
jgi:hypothetical protein